MPRSVKKKKKKPMGRPTKYKEEYCELLINHMSSGLSFESFAGVVLVNQDTLHEWCKKHKNFSEAKKMGRSRGCLAYEKLILAAAQGQVQNFNSTAAIWFGKNVHGWRDKIEADIKSDGFKISLDYGKASKD